MMSLTTEILIDLFLLCTKLNTYNYVNIWFIC